MTLVQELQALDLSRILDARTSISLSLGTDGFNAMVSGGATVTALGDFGRSLTDLQRMLDDPSELIRPLVDAVVPLGGRFAPDMAVFGRYRASVEAGADVLGGLLGTLSADPALFGQAFGRSLGDAFGSAASAAEGYLPIDLGDFADLRAIVERVDSGVPLDPARFAELALDVLSPFARSDLVRVRAGLDRLFGIAASVTVDVSLTAPLVTAFHAVAAAETSVQVAQALAELTRVRDRVLVAIRAHYEVIARALAGLPIGDLLRSIASAGAALRAGEQDILAYLERWRSDIARARELVAGGDIAGIVTRVTGLLDELEAHARTRVKEVFDLAVDQLKEWVRGLLAELHLRQMRNEVRDFILGIAQSIRDADLDAVASETMAFLATVRTAIDDADLGASIRGALEGIEASVTAALGGVIGALQAIGAEVNAVAVQAGDILERTATVLATFKATADGITRSVEQLGIEEAAQQVVQRLSELRETATALLTKAPLPAPLREQVTQLIQLVEGVDVEAIFAPIRGAVDQLQIPDEVVTEVTASLAIIEQVVQNLIPAELIASIQADVDQVLETIRGFDPAALLEGVSTFITETADSIDAVSVTAIANDMAAPFQQVLDAVDALHPRRLLAPVIDAYDALIGRIPVPSPSAVVDRTVGTVSTAAEAVTRTATQPARSLLPATVGTATAPLPPAEASLPGDFVRLLGHLPNALREALATLEVGPAGEVMSAIDGCTGGLARDLREVATAVAAIEGRLEDGLDALLAPLAIAQSNAQLSLHARSPEPGFNLDAAMTVTADAGPGALRVAVVGSVLAARDQARDLAVMAGGGIGLQLARAADLLEGSRLGRLAGDLDAFLAALDPEPIADELDALVLAVMARIPEAIAAVGDTFAAAIERVASLMEELNPGVQAHRFLEVLTIVQEELDLLNPRRLAAELGEVHLAIRDGIAAYDPRLLAAEIDAILDQIATSLRAISPAELLGDITFLDDVVALVENAVPTAALAGVGGSLAEVGATIHGLDLPALVDAVEGLGPRVVQSLASVIAAIRNELLALLESLHYASGNASVSVSAGASG